MLGYNSNTLAKDESYRDEDLKMNVWIYKDEQDENIREKIKVTPIKKKISRDTFKIVRIYLNDQ